MVNSHAREGRRTQVEPKDITRSWVDTLPKAELHVHIEGTLEPEMMLTLAGENGIELPYPDVETARAAYRFTDLQSFLDIYYRGSGVLRTRGDFAALMAAYLDRAAAAGVRRAEIFFDPQAHTGRGIGFEVFMGGFRDAIGDASDRVSAALILCFLRHLSVESAMTTLQQAEPHLDGVIAVGLDSSETDHPPHPFAEVYERARDLGLHAVAHAGEEGPPSYVKSALDDLGVERIDHGVRSLEDPALVARLRGERVPLTVCPLSNVALRVVPDLEDHPLPAMLDEDLVVSINSDDPAYFGGYVGTNYESVATEFKLGRQTLRTIATNSIRSSFLDPVAQEHVLSDIDV